LKQEVRTVEITDDTKLLHVPADYGALTTQEAA